MKARKAPRPAVPEVVDSVEHRGQRRADARRPAQPEHHPQQRGPGQAGPRPHRRADHPARERETVQEPGEQQAEHDGEGAEHPGDDALVVHEQAAQAARGRAVRGEQRGKAQHEEHGPGDRAAPPRPGRGARRAARRGEPGAVASGGASTATWARPPPAAPLPGRPAPAPAAAVSAPAAPAAGRALAGGRRWFLAGRGAVCASVPDMPVAYAR